MFWCSAFLRNELHALAHPQPLSWTAVPQAGSAARTEELSKAGMCWEMVQATDSSVFLMAQLLLPRQTQQNSQDSPDPIGKRLNCASWFPLHVTASSCFDYKEFVSGQPPGLPFTHTPLGS